MSASETMDLDIRAPTDADHAAWQRLWRGYQAFYHVDISDEVSAVTWGRLLDPAEPMVAALAWSRDDAVGLVHLIRHRSCWTADDYCYLQDLYVHDTCRGSGVGRRLIEYAYRWAEAAGCSRVHWLTHETNIEAMKLYDRIADRSGFIQYRKLFVPV